MNNRTRRLSLSLKCTIGSILFHHYSFWFDVTGASFGDPSVVGSSWVRVVKERRVYKANRVSQLTPGKRKHLEVSPLKSDVDILNVSDSILMSYEDVADLLQALEEIISSHFIRK